MRPVVGKRPPLVAPAEKLPDWLAPKDQERTSISPPKLLKSGEMTQRLSGVRPRWVETGMSPKVGLGVCLKVVVRVAMAPQSGPLRSVRTRVNWVERAPAPSMMKEDPAGPSTVKRGDCSRMWGTTKARLLRS